MSPEHAVHDRVRDSIDLLAPKPAERVTGAVEAALREAGLSRRLRP